MKTFQEVIRKCYKTEEEYLRAQKEAEAIAELASVDENVNLDIDMDVIDEIEDDIKLFNKYADKPIKNIREFALEIYEMMEEECDDHKV